MRTFVIVILVFFSLAPSALANGSQANGTVCTNFGANPCQSGVCGPGFTTNICLPCTATSCGSGQVCQTSGSCAAIPSTTVAPTTVVVPPSSAPSSGGPNIYLINPLKSGTSIESFLLAILDYVIRIGTIIIILMIVFVGYKFVVAQGKPAEIEDAKKMLLWTIVGALVLLGAKAISAGILATVKALGG